MPTMSKRKVSVNVWTVVSPEGVTVHEGYDFAAALAERRACGGQIVRVDDDRSPRYYSTKP